MGECADSIEFAHLAGVLVDLERSGEVARAADSEEQQHA